MFLGLGALGLSLAEVRPLDLAVDNGEYLDKFNSKSSTVLTLRGVSDRKILWRVWLLVAVLACLLVVVLGVDSALPGKTAR